MGQDKNNMKHTDTKKAALKVVGKPKIAEVMKKAPSKALEETKKAPSKAVAEPKKATPKTATDTKTATKTATSTKTSTDAYTQGNITVTGGAGKGATSVKIGLPGGALANNAKKATTAKAKK